MNREDRVAAQIASVVLGFAFVGGTVILCGLAALVVGLSTDTGYNAPTTANGWLRVVSAAASAKSGASAILGIALLVACTIATIAALRRRTEWVAIGILCGVFLGGTQVLIVWGPPSVDRLADAAASAIGNTSAVLPAASPTPEAQPLTVPQARDEITRMLHATIEASTPPLRTPEDAPVTVHQTPVSAVPCGEAGARLTVDLAFSTDDNAASLPRILAAWDSAGYMPDRAMQEDLRYSTELPIERMSIRDTTTIDGMLHLRLESACAVEATR